MYLKKKENSGSVSSQALRSFKVTMSVDPKFHPKIIGRKGAVISQIRKDHDVSIQFPDKGDEQQVRFPFFVFSWLCAEPFPLITSNPFLFLPGSDRNLGVRA